jgi:hypothetical protein
MSPGQTTKAALNPAGWGIKSSLTRRQSEVDDQIARGDYCPVPRWRYSRVHIPVECIGIQRAIVRNLGTHFNLRRKPMLPAQRRINVVGDNAGPLSLRVHEKFGSQGEVI